MRSTLLVALTLALVVPGCTTPTQDDPGPDQRAPVSTQAVDLDEDGLAEWVRLALTNRTAYDAGDVSIDATAPGDETRRGFACETAEGTWADGCQDPFFEAGDAWSSEDPLWVPCREPGQHQVTVELADGHTVDAQVSCQAAP